MKKELLYRVNDRLQQEVGDLSKIPNDTVLEILLEEIQKYVEEKFEAKSEVDVWDTHPASYR